MVTRIVILGNSVSAQKDGYAQMLGKGLSFSEPSDIVNVSLGGVGTLGLLARECQQRTIVEDRRVILETSLGDADGATPPDQLEWALEELYGRVLAGQPCSVTAVHIPRFDEAGAHQVDVVNQHNRVMARHGVSVVDMRDALVIADTTDGVHLSEQGAAKVAAALSTALPSSRSMKGSTASPPTRDEASGFVPVGDPAWTHHDGVAGSFRAQIPTVRLPPHGRSRVHLAEAQAIALMVVVGPSSGVVSISGSGMQEQRQTWDRWCTFRRIQMLHVPPSMRRAAWLEVAHAVEPWAEYDAWSRPQHESRTGEAMEIVGVLTRR